MSIGSKIFALVIASVLLCNIAVHFLTRHVIIDIWVLKKMMTNQLTSWMCNLN